MKKNKKKWSCVLVALLALLCTGCGEEPLELSEDEEQIIVNYSAHVVSKFNNLQSEGLTYVADDQVDVGKDADIDEKPDTTNDTETFSETSQPSETVPTDEPKIEKVSFQQALGLGQIAATYKGYDIASSYIEGDYYSVNAKQGKTFLIMHIDLTNHAAEAMNCNLLDAGPVFTLDINDGMKVQAETTILMDDLSTFSADLDVEQTTSTVLLFQIPEETASTIQSMDLQVLIHETTYDIGLDHIQ